MFRITNKKDRFYTFKFGFAAVIDGLVRIFSFGFIASSFQLNTARNNAIKRIENER
jgi:hypothetical protein